ncbi:MAG TPA: hypothetical protein VHE37_01420 [Nevskiaceae bacterium]|nr:hypothetical protein [Nevskiaceae bacterium]
MPGMAPNSKRASRYHGSAQDELPRELEFEAGDERSGRAGDLRSPADVAEEFPPERERLAGRTGGELPHPGITADDLAPETLLDDNRSREPAARELRDAVDSTLRTVDESAIGEGAGPDEAEMADIEPVAPAEVAQLKRKAKVARASAARASKKPAPPRKAPTQRAAGKQERRKRPAKKTAKRAAKKSAAKSAAGRGKAAVRRKPATAGSRARATGQKRRSR